jgi:hypothetical protein
MFGLVFLVVIGTSIWVAIDASHIGARKGLIKGSGNMGPAGWFVCCLLIWIIGFPVYLAKRSEIKAAAAASNVSVPTPVSAGHVAQNSVASPPGWYPQIAQSQQRLVEDTASSVASKADELVKLDALRKSGILTEQEFDAEKARLLGAPLPPAHSG